MTMKFQKPGWRAARGGAGQIGQAAIRLQVGTKVCIFLWVALLILNFVFEFGLLPLRRCW